MKYRDGTLEYGTEAASLESAVPGSLEESVTIQSQTEESDINVIVRRFGLTGQLPENVRVPLNFDFVDVYDFQSAQNALRQATESFMAMPADIRTRFDNDPHLFVEFCSDEKNLDEMRKMGLAVSPPVIDTTTGEVKSPGVVNPEVSDGVAKT